MKPLILWKSNHVNSCKGLEIEYLIQSQLRTQPRPGKKINKFLKAQCMISLNCFSVMFIDIKVQDIILVNPMKNRLSFIYWTKNVMNCCQDGIQVIHHRAKIIHLTC
jgi:hypothetical protein